MYRVEFQEPKHEEGALVRRFSEETAQAIGSLFFRNGQVHPFYVQTQFDDVHIDWDTQGFETRQEAIEAIFDDSQAAELVKNALEKAFAQPYEKIAERVAQI